MIPHSIALTRKRMLHRRWVDAGGRVSLSHNAHAQRACAGDVCDFAMPPRASDPHLDRVAHLEVSRSQARAPARIRGWRIDQVHFLENRTKVQVEPLRMLAGVDVR